MIYLSLISLIVNQRQSILLVLENGAYYNEWSLSYTSAYGTTIRAYAMAYTI